MFDVVDHYMYGVVPSITRDVDRRLLRLAEEHCGFGNLAKESISDSENVKKSSNEIPTEKLDGRLAQTEYGRNKP